MAAILTVMVNKRALKMMMTVHLFNGQSKQSPLGEYLKDEIQTSQKIAKTMVWFIKARLTLSILIL